MATYEGGISITLFGPMDEPLHTEYVVFDGAKQDVEGAVLKAATKVLQAAQDRGILTERGVHHKGKVEAKCMQCGTLWPYERGDGLRCPYCGVEFTKIYCRRGRPEYMECDGEPAWRD